MHGKMLTSAMNRAVSPCGCGVIFSTPPPPWPLAQMRAGSGRQGRVQLDGRDQACRADDFGHDGRVVPQAAADVDDPIAPLQLEGLD
jgi:hypothetical protein